MTVTTLGVEIKTCDVCWKTSRQLRRAVALLVMPGESGHLCKEDLDMTLDAADSGFIEEPVLLSFLEEL